MSSDVTPVSSLFVTPVDVRKRRPPLARAPLGFESSDVLVVAREQCVFDGVGDETRLEFFQLCLRCGCVLVDSKYRRGIYTFWRRIIVQRSSVGDTIVFRSPSES